MIVCNGMPWLPLQLKHIYPLYDEIIIVEGADQWYSVQIQSTNSTDGTLEYIRNFPDPDKKITLITKPGWETKDCMSMAYSKIITGDIVFHIDADEFMSEDVVRKCTEIFKREPNTYISVPQYIIYKTGYAIIRTAEEGPFWNTPPRVLARSEKYLIGHIPICYVDPENPRKKYWAKQFRLSQVRLGEKIYEYGIYSVHYSWATWQQMKEKILYHCSREKRPEIEIAYKLKTAKKFWDMNNYPPDLDISFTSEPRRLIQYTGWDPCKDQYDPGDSEDLGSYG